MIAPRYGGPEVLEVVEVPVPPAGPGQVTIEVRAAGVNPADFKRFAGGPGADPAALPIRPGFEVAGVITAIGADTHIASGGGRAGDAVLAFRVAGGYASAVTVPAKDVFAVPDGLGLPEAANLLLAGSTAMDMLRVVRVEAGETLLVHGASGAVGVMVLQLARLRGMRVVGTASERRFDVVRGFGGIPVAYGDGLLDRVRAAAPEGIDAALDCVGTDEAVDVSLEVAALDRIVTAAAVARSRTASAQWEERTPTARPTATPSAPSSSTSPGGATSWSRWPAPTRCPGRARRSGSSPRGTPEASSRSFRRPDRPPRELG